MCRAARQDRASEVTTAWHYRSMIIIIIIKHTIKRNNKLNQKVISILLAWGDE